MDKQFRISIELNDGQKIEYKAMVKAGDVYNLGGEIENALKANYFGVEMNGKLTIIPTQGIRKIEIEPAPDVLIAHVVRDVQPL